MLLKVQVVIESCRIREEVAGSLRVEGIPVHGLERGPNYADRIHGFARILIGPEAGIAASEHAELPDYPQEDSRR